MYETILKIVLYELLEEIPIRFPCQPCVCGLTSFPSTANLK